MPTKNILILDDVKSKIHSIRGLQVMLDEDLAEFYQVETKVLNQAVKRNKERFPITFMFQLTNNEFDSIRSQFVTLNEGRGSHRKYLPYAFTEQGVAMLSGVLKSDIAVKVSIQIISAFVSMRRFIISNAQIFHRLDAVERKQVEHDMRFEQVFEAIESKDSLPKQGIFFEGQIFDAYTFASDVVRSAKKSIILVDNYIDDTVLTLLNKRNEGVDVIIFTKEISKELLLDLKKHNSQYPQIEIKEFRKSHDRFMIIDDYKVYHFGASLKDLGKKWMAFSKFDKEALKILERLEK